MAVYLPHTALDALNALLGSIERSDCRINGRLELYSCKSARASGRKLLNQLSQRFNQDQEAMERAQLYRSGSTSGCGGGSAAGDGVVQLSSLNEPDDDGRRRVRKSSLLMRAAESSSASESEVVSARNRVMERVDTNTGVEEMEIISKKRLVYFISALNAAFPDFDFSSVKPSHFTRMSFDQTLKQVTQVFTTEDSHAQSDVQDIRDRQRQLHMNGRSSGQELERRFWTALDRIVGPHSSEDSITEAASEAEEKIPSVIDDDLKTELDQAKELAKKSKKQRKVERDNAAPAPQLPMPSSLAQWQASVEVYAYISDDATGAGDPYDDSTEDNQGHGSLWSHHLFFYNSRFKRLVFFTICASSWAAAGDLNDEVFTQEGSKVWEAASTSVTPENPSSPAASHISVTVGDSMNIGEAVVAATAVIRKRKFNEDDLEDEESVPQTRDPRMQLEPVSLDEQFSQQ